MKHTWTAAAAVLLFLFSGCVSGKIKNLLQEGALSKTAFREELPFEDRNGLIVVPVVIGGKTRQFLLDTGAPNLITPELARELGLINKVQFSVKDSQGKNQSLPFVQIDSLQMGGLTFYGTAAIVANLDAVAGLRCLEVDGFIGANLLRRTALRIDYAANTLVMASSVDSLEIAPTALRWPFTIEAQASPELMLRIGDLSFGPLTLDTGSSGWIDLPGSAYWKARSQTALPGRRTYGISSAGLYGEGAPDTLYRTWTNRAGISDTLSLLPASIDFSGNGHRIGNAFWRQFTLTIDWATQQVSLEPVAPVQAEAFQTLGFRPAYRNQQLQVGFVWEGTDADQQGLRRGDRILFMNGMDCINFSEDQYCRLWLNDQLEKWETLDLVVEQDGATRFFKLKKEAFFQE